MYTISLAFNVTTGSDPFFSYKVTYVFIFVIILCTKLVTVFHGDVTLLSTFLFQGCNILASSDVGDQTLS